MNRLVDHLLIMEGNGVIKDFPGNYTQYRIQLANNPERESKGERELKGNRELKDNHELKNERDSKEGTSSSDNTQRSSKSFSSSQSSVISKKQFSYKEKREFELLEKEIAALESEKNIITEKLNKSEASFEELEQYSVRIIEVTTLLDEKELRWLELSELIN